MRNQNLFAALLILLFAGAGFLILRDGENLISGLLKSGRETGAENTLIAVQEIKKQVSLPPPLRAAEEADGAFLTRSGVIWQTNIQRIDAGLPQLKESRQLDTAAENKLKDMFGQQYFAHVSPKGIGIDDLAQTTGYEYIAIGENLALGNYEDDKALVQAWMDSEGHRENILNTAFTEIGIAVGQGIYEGRKTWLALQEFGRPFSDCPSPPGAVKAQIDGNDMRLDRVSLEIEKKLAALRRQSKRSAEYNQMVDEYNALVEQYNDLLNQNKALISQYNEQVAAFNKCAGQ